MPLNSAKVHASSRILKNGRPVVLSMNDTENWGLNYNRLSGEVQEKPFPFPVSQCFEKT